MPIRILIADDHAVVREGLIALLCRETDLEIVAEATNGQEAVELFRQHKPNVVLMDLRMPQMNGVEATAAICREFPDARIVLLTTSEDPLDIHDALHAGAKRYLVKGGTRDALLQTIRAVHTDEGGLQPR